MQSSSRGGAQVRLLAIHTTEGIMRAADLRAWKTWPGSAHASADQYGALLDGAADGFVDYSRASWTLRNGNPVSDNLELCAQAKWSRADWLSKPQLLEGAALWLARRKKARPHIPLVKLSPADVRAGKAGVIGHNDWTVGMKDGSHWDPGPGFPWDIVLARANALVSGATGSPIAPLPVLEDFMSALSDLEQRNLYNRVMGFQRQRWYLDTPQGPREVAEGTAGAKPATALDTLDGNYLVSVVSGGTAKTLTEISSAFHQEADRDAANQAALVAQLAAVGGDPEALAAALREALGNQLAADVAARLTITAG